MRQHHINRSVAKATGEDLFDIERRGFSLADPLEVHFDPEPSGVRGVPDQQEAEERPPRIVDWDRLALTRNVAIFPQR